ncbi:Methyltransferase-like protein [Cynara cardunculus var. scolymus]|uniref:Methyltransferase-like protein n=1 Tax=Cynara cardunculus var. scolymus TaxID=59895 RepID=A0A103XW19_CYNCS|nr:Methyltransferase-like protein [Cynara cardunculus var. scolymus]
MAVSFSSPLYSHTYYPLKLLVPSNTGVRRRRSTAVQFQSLRFHGSFDVEQHSLNSRKHWDDFYERHQNKFFKDRHYLEKDWGQYFCDDNNIIPSDGKIMLEAGCGAGNTIFPLAMKYPRLFVHAYQMNVFVCNIAEDNLCDHIMPSTVDIVTLIFTLSAISPEKMPIVIQNLGRVLKEMLMNKNQVISENFYFRGDGTSSFYFSEDLLSELFVRAGFTLVDVNTYIREIKNRSRNITMQRRWIRAVFRRP